MAFRVLLSHRHPCQPAQYSRCPSKWNLERDTVPKAMCLPTTLPQRFLWELRRKRLKWPAKPSIRKGLGHFL